MSNSTFDEDRFSEVMPSRSFITSWDVEWIPESKNRFPRYAIDYSLSGTKEALGFDPETWAYLQKFPGFTHNVSDKRLSFLAKAETVFRKSYSGTLFTTDPDAKSFRDAVLSKFPDLKKLKEYVFEEGGLVDPIRTIADLTDSKKEDVKETFQWGKFALIGFGAYILYSKFSGNKK